MLLSKNKIMLLSVLFLTISINSFSQTKTDTTKIYLAAEVDEQPEFPGGPGELIKLLSKVFKTDVFKANQDIYTSKHVFSFVIQTNGKVTDVKLESPANDHFQFRDQLEIFFKTHTWKPGQMHGENVKVKYELPVYIHFEQN
jgi:hypothetical protein